MTTIGHRALGGQRLDACARQGETQGLLRPAHLEREDVAQAAWLRGWERLHQLRDEGKIVNWVNAIAANKHRRGSQQDARYQTLPKLCGQGGIDVAAIDAARILTLCRPQDRILFERQMGGLTTEQGNKVSRQLRFESGSCGHAATSGRASRLVASNFEIWPGIKNPLLLRHRA